MSIVADANGIVRGRFNVPSGVPVGTKSVAFTGEGGSRGETTYTGSSQVQTFTRRRVQTVTILRSDPLAQTFTLDETTIVAAVDVWVKEIGSTPVRCQIRETSLGLPNEVIIAESELSASELGVYPSATQFQFSPVVLDGGKEYAMVFLTDDGEHSLAIAELGKYSAVTKQWQTRQPYQVGVLLSSSNAVTWTPHQERDLRFRLYAAKFTNTSQDIDLGKVTLDGATDLVSLGGVERPDSQTNVQFIVTDANGNEYSAQEEQPLNLTTPLSGEVNVKARMTGASDLSPVLYQGVQLISGKQQATGSYVTRAFPGGTNVNLNVTFEASLPSGASVGVEAEIDGVWTSMSQDDSKPANDGFNELSYGLSGFNSDQVRVRLTLSGTPAARPRVRQLRAVTVNA
ncbi:hypothetical protein [Alteromonas sp. a30]|uniref:hypothetical protein n=1 Tax=Alteromonas sp. a30 TaxID=2730917 RepID=UPI002283108C|nr:hypothetical protein [Alteromonas sp. a30]MCY7295101.1 hypothetical protein [Alteromonas sp. a30]